MEIIKKVVLQVGVTVLSMLIFFLIINLFFGGQNTEAGKPKCGCGGHGKEEKKTSCGCGGATATTATSEAQANTPAQPAKWVNEEGVVIG